MSTLFRARSISFKQIRHSLSIGILLFASAGCVDVEGPVPQALAENQILSEIQITSPSLMMVLKDTVQLGVRAFAMDASEIPVDPKKVRWTSEDASQVSVDSLGRVVGLKQSTIAVNVIASYRHERTTRTDTILVVVTPTRLNASSIRLVAVDSNRVGTNAALFPRIRVDLYQGETLVMEGAAVPMFAPSPVTLTYAAFGGPAGEPIYTVDNRSYLGNFWIKAATNLYGTIVSDSIEFTGIYPALASQLLFFPGEDGKIPPNEMPNTVTPPNVQPCATVVIFSWGAQPVDVVFSDSTAASTECEPLTEEWTMQGLGYPLEAIRDVVGGNVMNVQPFVPIIRRSATLGIVSYYLRDAVTKERIPVSFRYNQISQLP